MTLSEAARVYIRPQTRFRHRGRKPTMLDCAGLVWIAYHDLGLDLPDCRIYGREPHEDGLLTYVRAALGQEIAKGPVPLALLKPDDVIIQRFEKDPHHMAIVGKHPVQGLTMIHADGMSNRVVEHTLSGDYLNRVTHVFRKPI